MGCTIRSRVFTFLSLSIMAGCGLAPKDFKNKRSSSSLPSAAEQMEKNDSSSANKPIDPNEIGALLDKGKQLYNTYCLACHGSIETTDRRNRTAEQIQDAVKIIPPMQHIGQNLSDEDYVAIAAALSDNLSKGDDPVGSGDNGGDPIALIDSDSMVVIGNRDYVASYYTSVFGPAAKTATDSFVIPKLNAFAGGCSRYESDPLCQPDTNNQFNDEAHVNGMPQSLLPMTNNIRVGYRIRACEQILSNDTAVLYALSAVGISESQQTTTANVGSLFAYFYPGYQATAEISDALVDLGAEASRLSMSNRDRWRFVLLPLCESALVEF